MSRRALLFDASPLPPVPPTPESAGKSLILHWSAADVPEGQLSVPVLLERQLPRIRAELLAWVYDLGRLDVGGVELQEALKAGDGLSMWWCSLLFEKHPKVLPGLYEALKLRVLELRLEEEGCDELCLVGGDAKLRAALESFCRVTNRLFSHVPGGEARTGARPSLPARLYYALPAPLKAVGRFVHWLWSVKRLLPRTAEPSPARAARVEGTVATYFPNTDPKAAEQGRFRSRYWEALHDAFAPSPGEPHGVHWLFIAFPSPQYSLRRCIELMKVFRAARRDGASFHYLEEFLGAADLGACLLRWARLCRASLGAESVVRAHFHFNGSHMDLWPHLGWAYADSFRGWRALERCLQRRACTRWAEWIGGRDWTIFPLENCPWERMLTQALHEAGAGPVWGAQHSTVRPADFRYFDDQRAFTAEDCRAFQPDRLFVNGRGALEEMRAAGYDAERVGMVEALRYMYLHGQKSVAGLPGERRLLLVTSFFADETDAQLAVLARAVQTGLLRDLAVLVKPHPYLEVNSRLARLFPQGGAPEITTRPLGELYVPGTVVWAANSTTAALEAAALGLPVMVQAVKNDFDLCPLHDLPGLARIRNADDLARALAAPCPVALPPDYLALEPALPRWRTLLRL